MLRVLDAWTQMGWSSTDHMIDDTKLDEIVGMSYTTRANMLRAAIARADLPGRKRLCRREFVAEDE